MTDVTFRVIAAVPGIRIPVDGTIGRDFKGRIAFLVQILAVLGFNRGWIDRDLDTWILRKISEGTGEELAKLFAFESDMFHGGTGEIRSWITVAGAFDSIPGEVVDYIPLHHAVTGLGFAYWQRPAEVSG